jgi:transcriptional regulator with XRE-family HTH domain
MMKVPIGARVKLVRRRYDWTQEELAVKAAVDAMTISRLERGSAKAVYADTVAALARGLGVSADYLLGLSEDEHGHL